MRNFRKLNRDFFDVIRHTFIDKDAVEFYFSILGRFFRVKSCNKLSIQLSEISQLDLPGLLKQLGLVPTTSEARRLITGHAVEINSERVSDPKHKLNAKNGDEWIFKVGKKKFAKVKFV